MDKAIEAVNLKKYYARGSELVKALDGVNITIRKGEIVSIVGPSGSGKTTLLNLVSCLDLPTDGNIKINGEDITKFRESQLIGIRRRNLGFIFQQFHLILTLTVEENVELPLIFAKKDINSKKISQTLERVGLKGKENLRVNTLNGGDKQRVAIARALVNNPKILIADEPTGELETEVRDSILDLFRKLAQSGLAIVVATHDLGFAEATERIIYLQDGKIVVKSESSLYFS